MKTNSSRLMIGAGKNMEKRPKRMTSVIPTGKPPSMDIMAAKIPTGMIQLLPLIMPKMKTAQAAAPHQLTI